jgi:hypothetical protein
MLTTFSLTYIYGKNTAQNMNGPFLFKSEEAALEHLFNFTIETALDGHNDVINEFITANYPEGKISREDATADLFLNNKEAFVDFFFEYLDDDSVSASYALNEIPTCSLPEMLTDTKAISVNGELSDRLRIISPMDNNNTEDVYLSVILNMNSNSETEVKYSFSELTNATYCTTLKSWLVGDDTVSLELKAA